MVLDDADQEADSCWTKKTEKMVSEQWAVLLSARGGFYTPNQKSQYLIVWGFCDGKLHLVADYWLL